MAEETSSTPPLPPGASGSDTGLPSNVAAGLCAAIPFGIGAAVFYFVEKKDLFVRHWAVQAIFFFGAWIAAYVAILILQVIFSFAPGIAPLFHIFFGIIHFFIWLAGVILWIIGSIRAFQGQKWEYPIISAQGKKYFPNLS